METCNVAYSGQLPLIIRPPTTTTCMRTVSEARNFCLSMEEWPLVLLVLVLVWRLPFKYTAGSLGGPPERIAPQPPALRTVDLRCDQVSVSYNKNIHHISIYT